MMKRFAHVTAGVIENISEALSSAQSHGGIELVPGIDDEIGIGDLYDGSVFSKKPKTPDEIAKEALSAEDAQAKAYAKAAPVIQYLATHTPAECEAYVAANVTDLASAKNLLGKFAIALCVLARREFR